MRTKSMSSEAASPVSRPIRPKSLSWFFILFITSLPFEQMLGMLTGVETALKPYRVFLVFVLFLALKQNNRFLRSARQISFGFVFILFYGLMLVSFWGMVGRVDFADTGHTLLLLSFSAGIYFSLIKLLGDFDLIDSVFYIFSLAVLASIIVWNFSLSHSNIYRVSGMFRNPNHFAYALSVAIIYFGYRSVRKNEKMEFRILWVATCLPLLYYLIISGSRAGLLGAAVGLFLLNARIISSRSRAHQSGKILLLAILFSVAFVGTSLFQDMNVSGAIMQRFSNESVMQGGGRLDIWKAGIIAAYEHAFIGMGVSQYISNHFHYITQLSEVSSDTVLKYKLGLHSEFMVLFVEYGLPGFLAYLFIVKKIWAELSRKRAVFESAIEVSMLLQALFASSLVQSAFQEMQIFPLYWLVLGVCVAYINILEQRKITQKNG